MRVLSHALKNLERIEPRSLGGKGFPLHMDVSTVAGFLEWAVLDAGGTLVAACDTAPRTFYEYRGGSNNMVELDIYDPIRLLGAIVEGSCLSIVEFTKEMPCADLAGVNTPPTQPMSN